MTVSETAAGGRSLEETLERLVGDVPDKHREVSDSGAAGRPQPKRESRSKRK